MTYHENPQHHRYSCASISPELLVTQSQTTCTKDFLLALVDRLALFKRGNVTKFSVELLNWIGLLFFDFPEAGNCFREIQQRINRVGAVARGLFSNRTALLISRYPAQFTLGETSVERAAPFLLMFFLLAICHRPERKSGRIFLPFAFPPFVE